MSFNIPTLGGLIDKAKNDLYTAMEDRPRRIRVSLGTSLAQALGGASYLLHKHLEYILKQMFPDTAEGTYLDRWANIWMINRKGATFAKVKVSLSLNDDFQLPEGTKAQLQDGRIFILEEQNGSEAVFRAENTGIMSDLEDFQKMELLETFEKVDSELSFLDIQTKGNNEESDESLRVRLLQRIRRPPHGGAKSDYEMWIKEFAAKDPSIPKITRIWVVTNYKGFTNPVAIFFVHDEEKNIIPNDRTIENAFQYIELKRPVTATGIMVIPPKIKDLIITVPSWSRFSEEVKNKTVKEINEILIDQVAPGKIPHKKDIEKAIFINTPISDVNGLKWNLDGHIKKDEIVVLKEITDA